MHPSSQQPGLVQIGALLLLRTSWWWGSELLILGCAAMPGAGLSHHPHLWVGDREQQGHPLHLGSTPCTWGPPLLEAGS